METQFYLIEHEGERYFLEFYADSHVRGDSIEGAQFKRAFWVSYWQEFRNVVEKSPTPQLAERGPSEVEQLIEVHPVRFEGVSCVFRCSDEAVRGLK